jgi:hypothetical protein
MSLKENSRCNRILFKTAMNAGICKFAHGNEPELKFLVLAPVYLL